MYNSEDHFHEKDNTFFTENNYYWTAKQEDIINVCTMNHIKNTVILRNLKEEGAMNPSGKYPNIYQLATKKRYLKNVKQYDPDNIVLNVEALRKYCKNNSMLPDDENKSFIPYHHIIGNNQNIC